MDPLTPLPYPPVPTSLIIGPWTLETHLTHTLLRSIFSLDNSY